MLSDKAEDDYTRRIKELEALVVKAERDVKTLENLRSRSEGYVRCVEQERDEALAQVEEKLERCHLLARERDAYHGDLDEAWSQVDALIQITHEFYLTNLIDTSGVCRECHQYDEEFNHKENCDTGRLKRQVRDIPSKAEVRQKYVKALETEHKKNTGVDQNGNFSCRLDEWEPDYDEVQAAWEAVEAAKRKMEEVE